MKPSKKTPRKKTPAKPAAPKSTPPKSRKPKSENPVETCPFDHDVERAVDCPYEESCPWHVRESKEKCFCSVGESPEMQMRKQLASRLPKE